MIKSSLQETKSNVYGILCAGILALFLSVIPPLSSVESAASDHRVARLSFSTLMDPDIVIVALDDATMERLSFRQPIDRAFLSRLIGEISMGAPRVIGLDVILDQPTRFEDDETLKSLITSMQTKFVAATPATGPGPFLKHMIGQKSWGVATFQTDASDSVVRQLSSSSREKPTFTQAIVQNTATISSSKNRKIRWPLLSSDAVPFITLPAHLVVSRAIDPAVMRDKIVLIGTTATGIDRHMTPLSVLPSYADGQSGVTVHAYAIKTMLAPDAVPPSNIVVDLILIFLATLTGALIGRSRAHWAVRVTAILFGAAVLGFATFALFSVSQFLLNMTAICLGFLFGAMIGAVNAHRAQTFAARRIEFAFAHYLDPEVVRGISKSPDLLISGAKEQDIAVLFTDLSNFSGLVETMEPSAVETFLNAYLDVVTSIIVAHGGTVDKIVGDGVHAFFGAPVLQKDAAHRAIGCALDIYNKTEAIALIDENHGFGKTRLGVHFGSALVGNFGGRHRLDYTAHGLTMNLASRLEEANKALGTQICASAVAVKQADLAGQWRPIGDVWLRGAFAPLEAWTICPTNVDRSAYMAAFAQIEIMPKEAALLFAQLPDTDPLVRLHRARLNQGLTTPMIDLR
ncbi:MAG: adenylate/guanylate cyclase domain-containing protein [Chakrabartia sp.]